MTQPATPPITDPNTPPTTPPGTPPPVNAFSAAQVEDLLAKARKEEKDKLYKELEALKTANKDLTTANKTSENAVSELKTQITTLQTQIKDNNTTAVIEQLKAEIAALKEGKPVTQPVTPPATPPASPEPNKEVEELKALVSTLTQSVSQLTEANKQANAVKLRDQLISEAGDDIIPDMITGNTEEEIKSSIENSRKVYANVYQKAAAKAINVSPANPSGEMNLPQDVTLDQIRDMSMADWAEKRKQLLRG